MPPKKKSPGKGFESPPVPAVEQFNPNPVIDKYLPEKEGYKRKIILLFSQDILNFYRVNFFYKDGYTNILEDSHFIIINRNTLELQEKK